jgi:hypothetical protein
VPFWFFLSRFVPLCAVLSHFVPFCALLCLFWFFSWNLYLFCNHKASVHYGRPHNAISPLLDGTLRIRLASSRWNFVPFWFFCPALSRFVPFCPTLCRFVPFCAVLGFLVGTSIFCNFCNLVRFFAQLRVTWCNLVQLFTQLGAIFRATSCNLVQLFTQLGATF